MKRKKENNLAHMFSSKVKVKKRKSCSDFELKMFKIELDNLNKLIRDIEEGKREYTNFEALRKLHHFNHEDKSVENTKEYFKLWSQVFIKPPPSDAPKDLKDMRDYLIKLIKEIEDKKRSE